MIGAYILLGMSVAGAIAASATAAVELRRSRQEVDG